LHVTGRDTGIGIPLEQRHRLFQPFAPGDASATRTYGGAGLGLSICKRLVAGLGGQIGIDSEPGRGSTFWFTVPPDTPLAAVHGLDAPRAACYIARQRSSV
jgi:signal transduction histidine kinase